MLQCYLLFHTSPTCSSKSLPFVLRGFPFPLGRGAGIRVATRRPETPHQRPDTWYHYGDTCRTIGEAIPASRCPPWLPSSPVSLTPWLAIWVATLLLADNPRYIVPGILLVESISNHHSTSIYILRASHRILFLYYLQPLQRRNVATHSPEGPSPLRTTSAIPRNDGKGKI